VLAGQRAAGRVDGAADVRHDHLLVTFARPENLVTGCAARSESGTTSSTSPG
jgi:hypothetical protein